MGQSWPLALALLAMIPSGAVPDEPKSPDEQFRALKAESDAAYAAFVRASEGAKTEEDQAAVSTSR